MSKKWIIASLRMTTQLLLVGFLLDWIFTLNNPIWILIVALFMTTISTITAVGSTNKRFAEIYMSSFVSIIGAVFFIMFFALKGILKIDPWYSPQYLFPLLGMILGNTINGISLGLDRFMDGLSVRRKEVEMLLNLGATSWESVYDLVRDALRTSLIPTINSMLVMGIVSLPGMMTGQILAGISPGEAVRYQIIVIFLIAAATTLSSTAVIILAFRALFSSNHQLLFNRLRKVK